jgi:hypothetical protein
MLLEVLKVVIDKLIDLKAKNLEVFTSRSFLSGTKTSQMPAYPASP